MPATGAGKRLELEDLHWNIAARPSDIAKLPRDVARLRPKARAPQGQRAGQGRAPVPRHQAPVRADEAALPRPGQEHGASCHPVRAVEPVDGATTVDGDGSSPSAKRMRHAERGESRSKRHRAGAIDRSPRSGASSVLAFCTLFRELGNRWRPGIGQANFRADASSPALKSSTASAVADSPPSHLATRALKIRCSIGLLR